MGGFAIPLMGQPAQIQTPDQMTEGALDLQRLAGGNVQQQQGIQIQQQQLAQQRIAAQQQANALAAQQKLQQIFTNNTGDYDKTRVAAFQAGLPMSTIQQLDADHLTQQKGLAEMNVNDKAKRLADGTLVGQQIESLLQLPQDQRAAVAQSQVIPRLQAANVNLTGYQFDPSHMSDDNLRSYAAGVGYSNQLLTNDLKAQQVIDAQAQAAQRDALAAKAQATADLQNSSLGAQDAASTHAQVQNADDHQQWWNSLSPDQRRRYPTLEKFGDPDAQQAILDRGAVNAQQSYTNAIKNTQLTDAETKQAQSLNGIIAAATDPTGTPQSQATAKQQLQLLQQQKVNPSTANAEAGRMARFNLTYANKNLNQANRDADAATKTTAAAQTQYSLHATYTQMINAAEGQGKPTVIYGGNEYPIAAMQAMANTALNKAKAFDGQVDRIYSQHGWGKYQQPAQGTAPQTPGAPGGAPPQAVPPAGGPAQQPPPQAAAPPPPPKHITDQLKPGVHTFGNGQTWQKNADGSLVFVK